jgi:predicted permease
MKIIETFSATLPVIMLVFVGIILQRVKLISRQTIDDLQRLVVNITLPLLLFKAFATMHFEARYFLLVTIIFSACTIVLFVSAKMIFIPGLKNPYASFLMAGFEAGMLGYAMFSAIYGGDNISYFAVIDLGQVLFVFFILITRLEIFQGRDFGLRRTLKNFFKTPVILGILAGGLVNALGVYNVLESQALTGSVLRAAEILAGMTTPLVAIVIGYGLQLRTRGLSEPVKTITLRLILWVVLALAFNYLVIRQLLGLNRMFEAAVLIMAILPAPFVVPFYLPSDNDESKEYILNTLSLGTVVALFASVIVRLIYQV